MYRVRFLIAALALALSWGAAAPAAKAPVVVHIVNYMYDPAVVTVSAGDRVTFVNEDQQAHTVTASDGKSFESDPIDYQQSWTYTFSKAGTFEYYCEPHPYMKGTVIVKAAAH